MYRSNSALFPEPFSSRISATRIRAEAPVRFLAFLLPVHLRILFRNVAFFEGPRKVSARFHWPTPKSLTFCSVVVLCVMLGKAKAHFVEMRLSTGKPVDIVFHLQLVGVEY